MASNNSSRSQSRHLDAFAGREVVFCHGCEREWYRDENENGLVCPGCHGEATEIVTEGNDPRNMDDNLFDLERHHHHLHDTDSDPDEGDIEDHTDQFDRFARGVFGQRTVQRGPESQDNNNNRPRAAPDDADALLRRFSEMMGQFGMPGVQVGRSGPDTLFGAGDIGGPRIRVSTFSRGPGFSGTMSTYTVGGSTYRQGNDAVPDFQSVFSNIIGHVGPPLVERNNLDAQDGRAGGAGDPRNDLSFLLNELFATILNPNIRHGDAVDSQEALDRIMTNLMEANPQSNAPPPASDETIAKLPKKKLDEEMLGPELRGECTICIDELTLGDEVLVLPCKHWFHEECVVLWLKEHNTCPICRAPIEGDSHGQSSEAGQANAQAQSASASSSRLPFADRRRTREGRLQSIRDTAGVGPYDRRNPRRNSNSPPNNSGSAQSSRARSPSPSSRQSTQSEQSRDSGSGRSGFGGWLSHHFRDRRNN